MSFFVGQILFVVLNKKSQVYPMLVVEEITKKTLQGEDTNYVLQGGADSSSTVLLTQVDGEIFESAEEARNSLVAKATEQIDRIVLTAINKSKEWYSQAINEQKSTVHELPPTINLQDDTTVLLPDGTVARIKNLNVAV